MTHATLKNEAIRLFAVKVEAMEDEAALKLVIDFLNGITGGDKQAVNLSSHYDAIKEKYGSVLKRLAE